VCSIPSWNAAAPKGKKSFVPAKRRVGVVTEAALCTGESFTYSA
jgi:hypothetical protein